MMLIKLGVVLIELNARGTLESDKKIKVRKKKFLNTKFSVCMMLCIANKEKIITHVVKPLVIIKS